MRNDQLSSDQGEEWFVERAMGGDLGAFEELVKRHQAGVRGFLAARLSRKDEVEDLAQEVFLTAFRKMATFSGHANVGAWLRGIARNLLMNHVRKFRPRPIGGNEELQTMLDQGLWAETQDGELLEVLRECLAELDGPARELVGARYLEGATVRDLERKTGRGYSALTMQLHRIRESLAGCMNRKMGGILFTRKG